MNAAFFWLLFKTKTEFMWSIYELSVSYLQLLRVKSDKRSFQATKKCKSLKKATVI